MRRVGAAGRGAYNPGVCTLAIYVGTSPTYPVVVAANRDEFYDRPASPPTRLVGDPWVIGGRDAVANGTWLGVNAFGVVAGLLNRRTNAAPDPTRRSRGLLCLDALRECSVEAAARRIGADSGDRYNPFNLLIASPTAACVVGNISGTMGRTMLRPGVHVLTNLDVNDFECPRIAKSYAAFDACRRDLAGELDRFLVTMRRILSDHSTPLDPRSSGPPNNLCVHTERFGTRSSTLLVYSAAARCFRMWYADGPPCEREYVEIDLPAPASAKIGGQA
jgi:uncharacterized protein with NRDE domain